jgi:molybdenum-dependent DNA-binding transcriptional regulator ModE
MRLFELLHVYVGIAAILRDPNKAFASLNQACRRARLSDCKVRRAIAALSREAGDPLVEVKNRRWGLTTIPFVLAQPPAP